SCCRTRPTPSSSETRRYAAASSKFNTSFGRTACGPLFPGGFARACAISEFSGFQTALACEASLTDGTVLAKELPRFCGPRVPPGGYADPVARRAFALGSVGRRFRSRAWHATSRDSPGCRRPVLAAARRDGAERRRRSPAARRDPLPGQPPL